MSRIQIPLDVITSRLNIGDRFSGFRNTSLSSRFANMKPIGEFLDFKRFSKPANFGEVQSRVNYNLSTFSSNYAVVFVLLSIYALITNPLLLFDIILLAGGLWVLGRLNGQDLTIGTFTATSSQLGGGLGGRPRAPRFAPSRARPPGRGQRGYAAPEDDSWHTSHRVVEELDSDMDAQGALTTTRRGDRRYAGDELRFTGIDLGAGRSRNKYAYQHSDEDNELTESDSQATTSNETEDEAQAELENALVQSALARIRKARAKGKQDVKLNKGEVAALERRRKRLESEAKAKDRKRKEKERRVAVPLSRFDSALSNPGGPTTSDDTLARQSPVSTMPVQSQSGPPMGLFLPPSTSQARTRSSTSSSHRSSYQHHGSSSPFDYQYVSPGADKRHISDTRPSEEDWHPQSLSSHTAPDPFQYQTAGPSAPYPTSSEAYGDIFLGGHPATARSGSGKITPEANDTGSDRGDGRQVDRTLRSDNVIVVEAGSSPEQEFGRSRNSSPGKRKSSGGRRRKGK
ncbi:hypothetical protein FHL15_002368 [Xylaria flabelliformis]|uniref:Prenylated Rab acceptor 1 n=1 Tax=Xylaria flabelliformis TaxID=2512241 RepID=A0A553I944_9PEZI|nr:hypothetical protein FHL15_002368 [Xylaria flabelliformis]